MTRLVPLAALLTLALGFGSAGGGTNASGLQGYVKRGPTRPVCRVGVPCTKPASGREADLLALGQGRRDRGHEQEGLVPRDAPGGPLHGPHEQEGFGRIREGRPANGAHGRGAQEAHSSRARHDRGSDHAVSRTSKAGTLLRLLRTVRTLRPIQVVAYPSHHLAKVMVQPILRRFGRALPATAREDWSPCNPRVVEHLGREGQRARRRLEGLQDDSALLAYEKTYGRNLWARLRRSPPTPKQNVRVRSVSCGGAGEELGAGGPRGRKGLRTAMTGRGARRCVTGRVAAPRRRARERDALGVRGE